jgi:predicted CoA-substrate-specific enzyme activase
MGDWEHLGVDIGAVSIGLAVLRDGALVSRAYSYHHGDIPNTLKAMIGDLGLTRARLGLTGRGAKRLAAGRRVNDVVAMVEGVKWAAPRLPRSVLLIGGENVLVITLRADGSYSGHEINTDCASGTGVFLDQQAIRLGCSTSRLAELAAAFSGSPPSIATRCAVFAKTDLIHSQQQGHAVDAIAAGLCDGVAQSLADTLFKDRTGLGKLAAAGGGALNARVIFALEKILGRKISVLPNAEVIPAIGAARLAGEEVRLDSLWGEQTRCAGEESLLNPPLVLERTDYPDFQSETTWSEGGIEVAVYEGWACGGKTGAYLGIDVGSTSTKLMVTDGAQPLLGLYTYTRSAPVQAVQRLFATLSTMEERRGAKLAWRGVGTTGSGRKLVGELIQADLIVNEISAHARAAVSLDPAVDTVIEIGGQDSKFIRVHNGAVVQAILNYICAAGTGSFIEEQAARLEVPLKDYSGLALGRRGPVISDRCTVYMERDLSRLLAEGWPREDLLASVLHSVRDNYLIRVVGQAKVGRRVCFQGATGRNKALVAAFEASLQTPIRVSRFCHLAGALGVCLLLEERKAARTRFVGLGFSSWTHLQRSEVCAFCRNHCRITVVEAGKERAAWGFMCGREYEDGSRKERPLPFPSVANVYKQVNDAGLQAGRSRARRQPTIGLPQALGIVEYGRLWEDFFSRLGFRTITSPQGKDILSRGKACAQSEFCSPILLAHGHADWLGEKGVDFIFFPILLHGPRAPADPARSFYCYYTAHVPVLLRNSPLLRGAGRLLSPVLDLRLEPGKTAASLFRSLGRALGLSKEEIRRAFEASWGTFGRAQKDLLSAGRESLREIEENNELGVVLLGRPYNLLDRTLNQKVPDLVQQHGGRVLTAEMLDLESLDPGHASDYSTRTHWHYGQRILRATEYIGREPRLFPVYVTNFRCSPDAFITSHFKEIMERQGKPYLIIQLDELSSEVGTETRIEAALESFRNWKRGEPRAPGPVVFAALSKDKTWILPHLDDTAMVLARSVFRRFGYEAVISEESQETIVKGLKLVGGGECVPTGAVLGGIVQTVKKNGLAPERTAALIPSSLWSCNFPQIPIAVKMGLSKAGLDGLEVFTTGVTNQKLPALLEIAFFKTYILGGLLNKMTARIRPREKTKGEAEAVKRTALARLSRAILDNRGLPETFREAVRDFAAIPVIPGDGRRPRLAILGDLYVVCNSTFNQHVEEAIEAAGGEALPSSFVEISHYGYLNKVDRSLKDRDLDAAAKARALLAFVRYHDRRWTKEAAPVLGNGHPAMDGRALQNLRRMGIPAELDGETPQNIAMIFYYLQHLRPDGFVHINPLYCCPGAVSSALLKWVEKEHGIPVINLFYDGLRNPNENLEPYVFYLRQKKEGQPPP